MEVTALCFTLIKLVLMLMIAPVQNSDTQKRDAVYLRVDPNRLQHFYLEPVTFICVGFDGLSQLKAIRNTEHFKPACDIKRKPTGSYCNIDPVYLTDRGQYWCETEDGEKSNTVNITVTAGPVILESPALPVKQGNNVTLLCRTTANSTNIQYYFYKGQELMESRTTSEVTINNVSKSHEGLYSCSIPGVGTSSESQLVVSDGPVILESPALPVKEGNNVTLHCRDQTRTQTSTNIKADFYKDGIIMEGSPTAEMTITNVSKSHEGLYKCSIPGVGTSSESQLVVRARHTETCPSSHQSYHVYLILRTVFTIVMVALLLLLLGLLHCWKLRAA